MRFLLYTLLLLASAKVFAAPIVVRSGQHDGFDRLTFQTDQGATWQLVEGSPGEVTLQVNGHSDGFDTSQIFRRIGQTRLSDVRGGRGEITLVLGCDCVVRSDRSLDNLVVLDIAGSSTGSDPKRPDRLFHLASADEVQPREDRFRFGNSIGAQTIEPAQEAAPVTPIEIARTPELESEDLLTGDAIISAIALPKRVVDVDDQSQVVLDVLGARLREEVGAALTRGLLEEGSESRILQVERQSAEPYSTSNSGVVQIDELLAREVKDVALTTGEQPVGVNSDGLMVCPSRESYSISTWGTAGSFRREIAAARSELYSVQGAVDRSAAIKLARTYLFFGFGAEAMEVLNLLPTSDRDAEAISAAKIMVNVLQEKTASGSSFENHLSDCDPEVALWTTLHTGRLTSPAHTQEIVSTLGEFPIHLRKLLSQRLSEILKNAGDNVNAAAAIRTARRSRYAEDDMITINLSQQPETADEVQELNSALLRQALQNDDQAVRSLIMYVGNQVESGGVLTPDIASLVETYVVEHRGSEFEKDLNIAYVYSLAKSQQFDEAFQNFETLSDEGRSLLTNSYPGLFGILAETPDDLSFVQHAIPINDRQIESMLPETAIKIANRLLEVGFFSDSIRYLDILEAHQAQYPSIKRSTLSDRTSDAIPKQREDIANNIDVLRAKANSRLALLPSGGEAIGTASHADQDGAADSATHDIASHVSETNSLEESNETVVETPVLRQALDLADGASEIRIEIENRIGGSS